MAMTSMETRRVAPEPILTRPLVRPGITGRAVPDDVRSNRIRGNGLDWSARRASAAHGARDFSNVPLAPSPAPNEAGNASRDDAMIAGGIAGGLLGAAAGAGIGFAVGGPIGALVGGLIGGAVGGGLGVGIGAAAAGGGGAGGSAGHARSVDVQPVVFRTGPADPSPTGGSWVRRFGPSNTIWGKLGVTFNDASPVVIDDATLKSAGSNRAERDSTRAAHADASRICVFLTDNDLADAGGGGTVGGGAAGAKIALSDRGTSNTLLAHELGHVLGLGHPPTDADDNTVMTPSASNNVDNPTRNTLGNYNRITWPAAGAPVTIHSDP